MLYVLISESCFRASKFLIFRQSESFTMKKIQNVKVMSTNLPTRIFHLVPKLLDKLLVRKLRLNFYMTDRWPGRMDWWHEVKIRLFEILIFYNLQKILFGEFWTDDQTVAVLFTYWAMGDHVLPSRQFDDLCDTNTWLRRRRLQVRLPL